MDKRYFTIKELSEITSIPANKLRYAEKTISSFKVNQIRNRRYYSLEDIECILNTKQFGISLQQFKKLCQNHFTPKDYFAAKEDFAEKSLFSEKVCHTEKFSLTEKGEKKEVIDENSLTGAKIEQSILDQSKDFDDQSAASEAQDKQEISKQANSKIISRHSKREILAKIDSLLHKFNQLAYGCG